MKKVLIAIAATLLTVLTPRLGLPILFTDKPGLAWPGAFLSCILGATACLVLSQRKGTHNRKQLMIVSTAEWLSALAIISYTLLVRTDIGPRTGWALCLSIILFGFYLMSRMANTDMLGDFIRPECDHWDHHASDDQY